MANSGSASQGAGRRVRDRRQKKCLVGKGRSMPLGTLGDRDPPSRLGALPTGSILVHSLAEGRSQNASAFCPAPLPVAPAQAVSPGDRVNGGECQGARVRHQQGQRHHFKKGKLGITCPRLYSEWQTGAPPQSPNSPRACLCGSPQCPGSPRTPQPPAAAPALQNKMAPQSEALTMAPRPKPTELVGA